MHLDCGGLRDLSEAQSVVHRELSLSAPLVPFISRAYGAAVAAGAIAEQARETRERERDRCVRGGAISVSFVREYVKRAKKAL